MIPAGTRVKYRSYGEALFGEVISDNGNGILVVLVKNGNIQMRRWLHKDSVIILEPEVE
jgi:hypothetical protein